MEFPEIYDESHSVKEDFGKMKVSGENLSVKEYFEKMKVSGENLSVKEDFEKMKDSGESISAKEDFHQMKDSGSFPSKSSSSAVNHRFRFKYTDKELQQMVRLAEKEAQLSLSEKDAVDQWDWSRIPEKRRQYTELVQRLYHDKIRLALQVAREGRHRLSERDYMRDFWNCLKDEKMRLEAEIKEKQASEDAELGNLRSYIMDLEREVEESKKLGNILSNTLLEKEKEIQTYQKSNRILEKMKEFEHTSLSEMRRMQAQINTLKDAISVTKETYPTNIHGCEDDIRKNEECISRLKRELEAMDELVMETEGQGTIPTDGFSPQNETVEN